MNHLQSNFELEYSLLAKLMGVSVSKHLLDEHFTVLWANDTYYELIGYSKKEYEELFHNQSDLYLADCPETARVITDKIHNAIANQINGYEAVVRMPVKGGFKWVKIATTFTDQLIDGVNIAYTVMTDIDDSMQEQLIKSITYESIPGFVSQQKICRDGRFVLLEANKKFADFVGLGENEVTSYIPFSSISDDGKSILKMNILHMRQGQPVYFTFHTKDRYGIDVCMQISGKCIRWEADEPIYLFVYIDVTEQYELQKKLKQQSIQLQEALRLAEKANNAKLNFLSNMSHDVRTPMNAIMGMTMIAKAHINNQEKVLDCLGKIDSSSKLLLSLINEVLDMSKIESGKLVLSKQDINIGVLLEELIVMMQPQTRSKQHSLRVYMQHFKHENVWGDLQRINQILMNILSNAIKYTPENGLINITVEEEELDGKTGMYKFIFEDNGIGMKPEFLDKIFLPFERANDDKIANIQGTGLGMSISYRIIKMMGGDIEIESEYGKGSRFTLSIPLSYREQITDEWINTNGKSILIIDNDELACITTCRYLDEIGVPCNYVCSGPEALEKIEQDYEEGKDYFAIVINLKMPGMNGLETIRHIWKILGMHIPIIILSNYDIEEYEEEARTMKIDSYMTKPVYKSKLVRILKSFTHEGKKEVTPDNVFKLSDADYSDKRILLVEDNELNREIAIEILSATGATVDTATNGLEAVEIMRKVPTDYYNLILMDIQMPVMDGYEATQKIRLLPNLNMTRLPIVAMTANAFSEDIVNAVRAGMNNHLSKPIDIKALMKILNTYLS